MQELLRIKKISFCVIRVLSGKFKYIRLDFSYLNAEAIISNATWNRFSSYLLNCILSTLTQLISPGRQSGSSVTYRHTAGQKDAEGTRGHKMFMLMHIFKTRSGFRVINNYGYVDLLWNFKIIHFLLSLSPNSSVKWPQNTKESLWEGLAFPWRCRATLQ